MLTHTVDGGNEEDLVRFVHVQFSVEVSCFSVDGLAAVVLVSFTTSLIFIVFNP